MKSCMIVCIIGLVATIIVLFTVVAIHRKQAAMLEMMATVPTVVDATLIYHTNRMISAGILTGSELAGDRIEKHQSDDGLAGSGLAGDRIDRKLSGSQYSSNYMTLNRKRNRMNASQLAGDRIERKLSGSQGTMLARARSAVDDMDVSKLV